MDATIFMNNQLISTLNGKYVSKILSVVTWIIEVRRDLTQKVVTASNFSVENPEAFNCRVSLLLAGFLTPILEP